MEPYFIMLLILRSIIERLSLHEKKVYKEQFSLWMDMFYRLSLAEHVSQLVYM